MADPITTAFTQFGNFGQQQLANRQTQQQIEVQQRILDADTAAKTLTSLRRKNFIGLNKQAGRVELKEDAALDNFANLSAEEANTLFNLNSALPAYTTKDKKLDFGTIGKPVVATNKLPTWLKDKPENELTNEEKTLKEEYLSGKRKVYIMPIKKKDGMFSFVTRGRSEDEFDNEAVVLDSFQVMGLMNSRLDSLLGYGDVESQAYAEELAQIREYLGGEPLGQGVGDSGVTVGGLMEEEKQRLNDAYSGLSQVTQDMNLAGKGSQLDALGMFLEQLRGSVDAETKKRWDAVGQTGGTEDAAGKVTQQGGTFNQEKAATFKEIDKVSRGSKSKIPLLKNGGGIDNIATQIPGIIDGSISGKDIKYSTSTALFNFWKTKKGNEGATRLSDQWKSVQNDPKALQGLADEYYKAVKQQISDAGFDLKFLEDYADVQDTQTIDTRTAGATTIQTPDLSDLPDLQGIKTKDDALSLIQSGQLDTLLSPEDLEKFKKALTDAGVTDAESFNKAVKEKKIDNPYLFSMIIAHATGGAYSKEQGVDARKERTERALALFNAIETGDPSTTPLEQLQQLSTMTQNAFTNRKNYLDALNKQSKEQREAIQKVQDNIIDELDAAMTAFTSRDQEENKTGPYRIAMNSMLGYVDQLGIAGLEDPLGAIAVTNPTLFRKFKDVLGQAIDFEVSQGEKYDSALLPPDAEWWGDLFLRSEDPSKGFIAKYEDLVWVTDSKDGLLKLARRRESGDVEADQSIPLSVVREFIGPELTQVLTRIIPTVDQVYQQRQQNKRP